MTRSPGPVEPGPVTPETVGRGPVEPRTIEPETIEPGTKDWTWVLVRPCPDCGLDAGAVTVGELAGRVLRTAATWRSRLAPPDAEQRPSPSTWSPLEHGAHVRDVRRLARTRVSALLAEHDSVFADWDQDASAVELRYLEQQPARVAAEVEQAVERLARSLDGLSGEDGDPVWQRPGRRSDGSVFTVASLGRCILHDLVHHEEDVRVTPLRDRAVGDPGGPAEPSPVGSLPARRR